MSNKDEQASPVLAPSKSALLDGSYISGLTKREYFTAMAMQGLLSAVYSSKEMLNDFTQDKLHSRSHVTGCKAVSDNAIAYADALLEELSK